VTWLLFVGALELAWFPMGALETYEVPSWVSVVGDLGVTMEGEARIGGPLIYAFVGGQMSVLVTAYRSDLTLPVNGWPTTLRCLARIGLRAGVLEIGAEHSCTHPVVPILSDPAILWEGGYERIYIRVGGRR